MNTINQGASSGEGRATILGRALDWLADATGLWLALFVVVGWAISDAIRTPTFFIPYDRCVVNALLALAICRFVYRGARATQGGEPCR